MESKSRMIRRAIQGILIFLVVLNVAWWLLGLATDAWIRPWARSIPELVWRSVVFTAGFLVVAISMAAVGTIWGRRRGNPFHEMVGALRRIAQGDFSARVELPKGHRENPFEPVVSTFNEMTESLRRMELVRQEFISNVSHEIQSPLTSIKGFAQALRDPGITPEQWRRSVSIIEEEADRLSRLSDSLLKLSSLEVQSLSFRPFRLDAQLRSVIVAAEPQWRAKRLQWEVDLPEITWNGDELLLGQVWTNLIHNAVKFTPEEGRLTITARAGTDVTVEMSDTGLGLTPEQAAQVFDRFYKADTSRSASAGGSGLGLSIVKKTVEKHGGRITVESSGLGMGTTVRVVLPRDQSGRGALSSDS